MMEDVARSRPKQPPTSPLATYTPTMPNRIAPTSFAARTSVARREALPLIGGLPDRAVDRRLESPAQRAFVAPIDEPHGSEGERQRRDERVDRNREDEGDGLSVEDQLIASGERPHRAA